VKTSQYIHVGDFISDNREKDPEQFTFRAKKFIEIYFSSKLYYEDITSFKKVEQLEITEMNSVSSLYAVLDDFVERVRFMWNCVTLS
jgi:hypothetical protein